MNIVRESYDFGSVCSIDDISNLIHRRYSFLNFKKEHRFKGFFGFSEEKIEYEVLPLVGNSAVFGLLRGDLYFIEGVPTEDWLLSLYDDEVSFSNLACRVDKFPPLDWILTIGFNEYLISD